VCHTLSLFAMTAGLARDSFGEPPAGAKQNDTAGPPVAIRPLNGLMIGSKTMRQRRLVSL
jgi:hypothetical protein